MSYELPPDINDLLPQHLATGLYAGEDEVLREALDALSTREKTQFRPPSVHSRDELLQRIDESRRQLDAGEWTEYDDKGLQERFDDLKRRIRNRANNRHDN